jgi:hypothetical protein
VAESEITKTIGRRRERLHGPGQREVMRVNL